ncbi:uncharacterized protein LOC143882634 [Tasmannia lanceolata]|uniref:uncharacterized protein LOC143882634 n=1 Tax=Tasmannia lanceolata TaxID=3420 RepID=UPI0040630C8F
MALSSPNQWPQDQMEDRGAMMASTNKIMEKTTQDQALKCPRCDSSNTKFCYYNNYSLSQPRHFCKACKRYWTRGGTLRNVPVGGGCRKNKRVKRPAAATDHSSSLPPPSSSPQIDIYTPPNNISHLLYGLPNTSDINLAFPSNADNVISSAGYDLQPQMNSLWLSYPSLTTSNAESKAGGMFSSLELGQEADLSSKKINHVANQFGFIAPDVENQSGFFNHTQIKDSVTSTSLLPDFSLLCSSTSSISNTLVSSSFHQQKLLMGLRETRPANDFQVFLPFEDLQMEGNGNSEVLKGVKTEGESNVMRNKVECHVPGENPFETIAPDSSFYWNPSIVGAWPDASNYGSSITPLI